MNIHCNILLVEDDLPLAYATKYFLEHKECTVVHCTNADDAWRNFMRHNFHVILLDVILPGKKNGFELATLIRNKNKRVPIIFLSAKTSEEERIEGLETGADCYLPKPFNFEELFSRIQVFLKYAPATKISDSTIFRLGGYVFDYSMGTLGDSHYMHYLTKREADLLRYLCNNADQVIKREQILMDLWGKDDHFLGRSLDVFITKIRKYFRSQTDVEIQTIHGVGFKLVAKVDIGQTYPVNSLEPILISR